MVDDPNWESAADESLERLILGSNPIEVHIHEVMLCASSPVGMRLLLYALSHGCVRIKDMCDLYGDSIYSVRGAMMRMQKRWLFKKRQVTRRDPTYVLTYDGHTIAKCIERLSSTYLGGADRDE